MKVFSSKFYVMVCLTVLSAGCDTSLEPSEWDENWNMERVCYTVYLENSHQPIPGTTILIMSYNHPDCSTCPLDLNLVTDANGEVCKNMAVGWTCDAAVVSATSYVSHMFTGKPPAIIYLVPVD